MLDDHVYTLCIVEIQWRPGLRGSMTLRAGFLADWKRLQAEVAALVDGFIEL
jgi:hypothetical protein